MATDNNFDITAKLKLSQVAVETEDVLRQIVNDGGVTTYGECVRASILYNFNDLATLEPQECPRFTYREGRPSNPNFAGTVGTRILVFNKDTIDTALMLSLETTNSITTVAEQTQPDTFTHAKKDNTLQQENVDPQAPPKPILILNLASDTSPGGLWCEGIMGQEEELFYRTSLSYSLHPAYYPLKLLNAVYSPKVFIIRSSYKEGHQLSFNSSVASAPPPPSGLLAQSTNIAKKYGELTPQEFQVVSVISIAGLRDPAVTPEGTYQFAHDKEIMKYKIRLMLRIAARQGHTKLVLGALGCGKLHNPPRDVANVFLQVLQETEFQGGWWDKILFAVMDNVKRDEAGTTGFGNFGYFYRELDGKIV